MSKNCLVCNKEFEPDRANLNRGNGNCCSKNCENKRRWKEPNYRSKMMELRKNPVWLEKVGKDKGWSTRINNICVCRFCKLDINTIPKFYCCAEHIAYNERFRSKSAAKLLSILLHYGNKCACVPCGFDDFNKKIHGKRFLNLDHINGNGYKQRSSGQNLYNWIIKNNYPPGFRVL